MEPLNVFYSYSSKDEELRDELEKHLSILRRNGTITNWHFRKIVPGAELDKEISEHLEHAQIILLLISNDFLASDYCVEKEMTRALEKHRAGEARVIPIIVRSVDWKEAPFSPLEALPKDALAVTSWPNRDEAWTDVALGIRRTIKDFLSTNAASVSKTIAEVRPVARATGEASTFDYFVGDSGFDQRQGIRLVGYLTVEDPRTVTDATQSLVTDLMRDPYWRLNSVFETKIQRGAFSYDDPDSDVRTFVAKLAARVPFQAYTCFAPSELLEKGNENAFEKLFRVLLTDRIGEGKDLHVNLHLPPNRQDAVRRCSDVASARLKNLHLLGKEAWKNTTIGVDALSSFVPVSSLAAYTCEITRLRLEAPKSADARQYARIANKVRLIHDIANGIFYSRRNPLPEI